MIIDFIMTKQNIETLLEFHIMTCSIGDILLIGAWRRQLMHGVMCMLELFLVNEMVTFLSGVCNKFEYLIYNYFIISTESYNFFLIDDDCVWKKNLIPMISEK